MLVVDRSILHSEFELMEISADLIRAQRQLGSSSSILDSSEASKGISPTSLGVPPPTYEDVFPDFPPSYSEISLMQKDASLDKRGTCDNDDSFLNSDSGNGEMSNCVQRDS
ncbi:unnamed protein product [Phyllotreta striolata]|uniref:Uncharacterized protein n=1 Tax=Phyllotreta striolata TaxID=444603 RepID=A0A9N9TL57_PHYSR|nr:unnamed protein product [Phyllotreta striolata]